MSQVDLAQLLAQTSPFDGLPADQRTALAQAAMMVDVAEGERFIEVGQTLDRFFVITAGVFEVSSATGKIFGRLKAGETIGWHALREGRRASYRAVATEPAAVAAFTKAALDQLDDAVPEFSSQIAPVGPERFRSSGGEAATTASDPSRGQSAGIDLMTMTTRDLMTSEPITVTPDTPILAAAQLMKKRNISCLPIVEGDTLVGMLTDGDLRDRVLAEGVSTNVPVEKVMTPNPIALSSDALAFDALVTMMHRNISHLPVTEDGKLSGILTHTNLVRAQSRSAVYMIGEIHRLSDTAAIADIVKQIPDLLVSLVSSGASARKIGHIITSIADATTIRLLRLAEDKLGPAPVPYLWLACGSQGRQEQTGISDQDNCLFLDDAYDEAAHGDYFEALATFVSDGLDQAGYYYCPGDMMATNPKWRQPLKVWTDYFSSWIATPQPMAQMLASVMFDLRPIHGDVHLFDHVQDEVLAQARKNSIFIAHMVSNSLKHQPPLGMFGQLKTEKTKDGRHAVDLKHGGVVPIVDIARVYALEAGIKDANTHERLEAGRQAKILSDDGARSLLAAFDFIAMTRLRHQAEQIRAGRKPDNYLVPNEISPLERSQLKDSFQIVRTIQQSLANARQMGG